MSCTLKNPHQRYQAFNIVSETQFLQQKTPMKLKPLNHIKLKGQIKYNQEFEEH